MPEFKSYHGFIELTIVGLCANIMVYLVETWIIRPLNLYLHRGLAIIGRAIETMIIRPLEKQPQPRKASAARVKQKSGVDDLVPLEDKVDTAFLRAVAVQLCQQGLLDEAIETYLERLTDGEEESFRS